MINPFARDQLGWYRIKGTHCPSSMIAYAEDHVACVHDVPGLLPGDKRFNWLVRDREGWLRSGEPVHRGVEATMIEAMEAAERFVADAQVKLMAASWVNARLAAEAKLANSPRR